MTNQLGAAIENVTSTFPLWREAGDAAGLSAAHDSVRGLRVLQRPPSDGRGTRRPGGDIAGSVRELAYGEAQVTRAYLAIQRSDYQFACSVRLRGIRIAERHDSASLALRSEMMSASMSLALQEAGAREALVSRIEAARGLVSTSWPRPATPASPTSTSSSADCAPPSTCWRSR